MNAITRMTFTTQSRRAMAAIALIGAVVCGGCHKRVCEDYLGELKRLDAILRAHKAAWDSAAAAVQSATSKGLCGIDLVDRSYVFEDPVTGANSVHASWSSFSQQGDGTWTSGECTNTFTDQEWREMQTANLVFSGSGGLWLSAFPPTAGGPAELEIEFPVPGRILGETSLLVVWSSNGMSVNGGTQVFGFTSKEWCYPKKAIDLRWCRVAGNWCLAIRWS